MGNIVLIGFMGAGKSTIAQLLGARLGYDVLDTDALIERRAGMSIAEIFDLGGDNEFREREAFELHQAVGIDDAVIAAGGGAILRPENLEALSQDRSIIVYLRARAETLVARIGRGDTRPLLRGDPAATVPVLLADREDRYNDAANMIIDTDALTPQQVVNEIVERLE
ncbi:MAG: shikimate kinase AroK [Actinomycetota bacterium]